MSFNALFNLGDVDENATLPETDPVLWVRLSAGITFICQAWLSLVGHNWIASSGVFYGEPDLSDDEEVFNPKHCKPFENVLTWALEYERMTDEHRDAYQKALSYIGLIYNKVIEDSEPVLAISRRFIAMPARLPSLFSELVDAKMPRAMVIMAHAFA